MQKNIEKKKRKEKDNDNFSPIIDLKQENDIKFSFPTSISNSPPPPPYSNLKNGSKPTFSQWKSQNNNESPSSDIPIHNDSFEERQNKLSVSPPTFGNLGKMNSNIPPPPLKSIKKKQKKKN